MNYPMEQDFASDMQKEVRDEYLLRGSGVDGPVRPATIAQLTPGPVFPRPTPQVRLVTASVYSEQSLRLSPRLQSKIACLRT